eukprot:GHUV01040115.1.p2 GENE.GHUV01040115.1~~GHUV01040115.1.p2  ORF type:complete len:100 (+),score=17.23 GHUV01040115.1:858-1157(+)
MLPGACPATQDRCLTAQSLLVQQARHPQEVLLWAAQCCLGAQTLQLPPTRPCIVYTMHKDSRWAALRCRTADTAPGPGYLLKSYLQQKTPHATRKLADG